MHKYALVKDLFFKAKILETAKHLQTEILFVDSTKKALNASLLIVDLEEFGLSEIKEFKEKNPNSKIIGYLSHVNISLKKDSEKAGCIVYSRSEFTKNLSSILTQ